MENNSLCSRMAMASQCCVFSTYIFLLLYIDPVLSYYIKSCCPPIGLCFSLCCGIFAAQLVYQAILKTIPAAFARAHYLHLHVDTRINSPGGQFNMHLVTRTDPRRPLADFTQLEIRGNWRQVSTGNTNWLNKGGMPGSVRLRDYKILQNMTKKQAEEKRLYAAICAAPAVTLLPWGLLRRKQANSLNLFT